VRVDRSENEGEAVVQCWMVVEGVKLLLDRGMGEAQAETRIPLSHQGVGTWLPSHGLPFNRVPSNYT